MRRLRYQVAASLDGYIADSNGAFDWIVSDPEMDFQALAAQFDVAVMGRKTFEAALSHGGDGSMPGMEVLVFSRTLRAEDHPAVSIVSGDPVERVRALKGMPGRDIWLYGGGELFRCLLDAGLVDTVEPAVIPVLLGSGIPILPPGNRATLSLRRYRLYSQSGILLIEYAVNN